MNIIESVKANLAIKGNLRWAWITNNGYDTLAIVRDDEVVSRWTVDSQVAADFVKDGTDIHLWDLNGAENSAYDGSGDDLTDVSDYGDELTEIDDVVDHVKFALGIDD